MLLLTQTFPPDPAAVGQHMADLGALLARRGHRVVVLTADRGYDDASVRYSSSAADPSGIVVRRLRYSSFGKATLAHRISGMLLFILQAAMRCATEKNIDVIVFSTSPPFVGVLATIVGAIRRTPTVFWAMDLNPDQLIALGKLAPTGPPARFFRFLNRFMLRRAAVVVALDPWMAARLVTQGARQECMVISPPWSPEETQASVPRTVNRFRAEHGLATSTVIMYSGNHTQSNPLSTLLAAAVMLRDVPNLKFVFIGGGIGKREVQDIIDRNELTNVLSLPYQPKSQLAESLSAGDVQVVSLGSQMTGVIHPCKVYGAMAVARPILYFGPSPSHVTKIIEECGNGWTVEHRDVESAFAILSSIAKMPFENLDELGARGRWMVRTRFAPDILANAVADAVESAIMVSRAIG